MIERAEDGLRELGFRVCRVRHHDDAARLEIGADELPRALEPEWRDRIVGARARGRLHARDHRPAGVSDGQPE